MIVGQVNRSEGQQRATRQPIAPGECQGVAVCRDIPGFCKSASLEEIRKHGHVLTPGRYVGANIRPRPQNWMLRLRQT